MIDIEFSFFSLIDIHFKALIRPLLPSNAVEIEKSLEYNKIVGDPQCGFYSFIFNELK